MDILYSAHLGTNSSWALVGRNTIRELINLGHRVRAASTNGWVSVPSDLASLNSISLDNPVFLGYTVPSRLPQVGTKTKFLIYNYESSILPSGWSGIINKHADMVLPASKYSASVMAKCGVVPDKIKIYPYGIDTNIFKKDQSKLYVPKDKFNFLYCAIPHARKGIDILFETFLRTFRGRDDVRLIFKTGQKNDSKRAPAFMINVQETLSVARAMVGGDNLPEIMIIAGDFDSATVTSIYNSAHAYVAPSRSEGFGMTVLEAMACGIPVIATAYSAHLDFLTDENSYMIETKDRPAPASMQYWQFQKGAVVGDPNVEQLSAHMKTLYDKDGSDPVRVKNGLKTANEYTWAKSVKKLENHMLGYLGAVGHIPAAKSQMRVLSVTTSVPSPTNTKTQSPQNVAKPDSRQMSRSDIRMRQANASNKSSNRDVRAILQSQKVQPSPTRVKSQMPPAVVVRSNGALVKNSRIGASAVQRLPVITPVKLGVTIFTCEENNKSLSKAFNNAIDMGLPVAVYGTKKPSYISRNTKFTQCSNSDFVKLLRRVPNGTDLVVDDSVIRSGAFLSSAVQAGSLGQLFCAPATLDTIEMCDRYQNIIVLYDSDSNSPATLGKNVYFDVNDGTNIFDVVSAPGVVI